MNWSIKKCFEAFVVSNGDRNILKKKESFLCFWKMISKWNEQRNLKEIEQYAIMVEEQDFRKEKGQGERSHRASRSSSWNGHPSFWSLPRTNGDQSTFQKRPLSSGIKEPKREHFRSEREAAFQKRSYNSDFFITASIARSGKATMTTVTTTTTMMKAWCSFSARWSTRNSNNSGCDNNRHTLMRKFTQYTNA